MSICLLASTMEELKLLSPLNEYEAELLEWSKKENTSEFFVSNGESPCEMGWESLEDLIQLPEINDSFFASWRVADIPVIFVAGLAGALFSYFSKDYFAQKHDSLGKKPAINGGHGGELIDRVPGAMQAGGFGHRWLFGHDLLNPFEIDWSQYVKIAMKSGTVLPIWMKAAFYWIRHLFQDTFSKEGLPLPGHSYFLKLLNWIQYLVTGGKDGEPWIDPQKHSEMLKIFGTIKMRDVTGTAVTALIMKMYLWGTEDSWKEANSKQNYRTCSLMLGAYWVNLCAGLMVPRAGRTLNTSVIPLIASYLLALVKINVNVSSLLQTRDKVIKDNWIILMQNDALIDQMVASVDKKTKELDDDYEELKKTYNNLFSKGV